MLDLFSSSSSSSPSSSSRGSRSIPVTNCYTSAQPHYHGASRSHRALSLFTDPMSIGRVSSFFHSGERVHHNDCVSLEDKAIIIISAHYCYEAAAETPLSRFFAPSQKPHRLSVFDDICDASRLTEYSIVFGKKRMNRIFRGVIQIRSLSSFYLLLLQDATAKRT